MAQPKYAIATIGSHSALQILKGAHDEGFQTIVICKKGKDKPYRQFKVADEILIVQEYTDLFKLEKQLKEKEINSPPTASTSALYSDSGSIMKISAPSIKERKASSFTAKLFPAPDVAKITEL